MQQAPSQSRPYTSSTRLTGDVLVSAPVRNSRVKTHPPNSGLRRTVFKQGSADGHLGFEFQLHCASLLIPSGGLCVTPSKAPYRPLAFARIRAYPPVETMADQVALSSSSNEAKVAAARAGYVPGTCLNCRRQKQRCDRVIPQCSRCSM